MIAGTATARNPIMNRKPFAIAVFVFRILYGLGLLAAPASITKRWLGPTRSTPAAQVGLRALGAREVAIHTGGLIAILTDRPIRPFAAMSIAGDLSDIVTTAAAKGDLPEHAAPATLAVAGGSALLTAAVGLAADA